jgi:hypothetical protein
MDHTASFSRSIVAWIGLDWADQKHDVCLQATGSPEVERRVVEQKPEALHAWVAELRRRFPHASGGKDDPTDALAIWDAPRRHRQPRPRPPAGAV